MRDLAAWIVGLTLLVAAVAKLNWYEKPNAFQGIVQQVALALMLVLWAGRRRTAAPAQPAEPSSRAFLQPERFLAAYAAIVALSPLWAKHTWLAAIAASSMLTQVLWALLLSEMLRRTSSLRLTLALCALASAAMALAAVWDRLHFPAVWLAQRQGHQNMLACFLLVPLFASAGVLAMRPGWPLRLLLVAGLAADLVLLVWTSAMGAWVGAVAGALLFWSVFCGPRWRLAVWCGLGAAAAAGLVALVVALVPGSGLRTRLLHTQQATRLLHIEGSLAMLARSPLLGWGAGNFASEFSDFKPREGILMGWAGNVTLHPHNEPVLIAVETGLVGLLIYGLAVAMVLSRAFRAADQAADATRRAALAASLAAFGATFVHGFFDVCLRFWGPMAAHRTAMGLLLASSNRVECAAPATRSRRASAVLALLVAVLVIVVFALPAHVAHTDMGRAEGLPKDRAHLRTALALYDRAAALSRYVPQYLGAHTGQASRLLAAGETDAAIDAFERLEAIAPGYGPVRHVLGRLYLRRFQESACATDAANAVELLARFVRQRPDVPDARRHYAQALLAASPVEGAGQAVEHLRFATQRDPGDPASWALLGNCLLRAGRPADALDALARASQLYTQEYASAASRVLAGVALGARLDPQVWAGLPALRQRLAEIHLDRGRAAMQLQRPEDARNELACARRWAADHLELLKLADWLEDRLPRERGPVFSPP